MRGFARAPADTRIDTMGFCVPSNTAVTLTGSAGPLGVHRDGNDVVWRIDAPRATGFAEQMETLADPNMASGSEILACGLEDETTVKLSHGEYTDDFLLPA